MAGSERLLWDQFGSPLGRPLLISNTALGADHEATGFAVKNDRDDTEIKFRGRCHNRLRRTPCRRFGFGAGLDGDEFMRVIPPGFGPPAALASSAICRDDALFGRGCR